MEGHSDEVAAPQTVLVTEGLFLPGGGEKITAGTAPLAPERTATAVKAAAGFAALDEREAGATTTPIVDGGSTRPIIHVGTPER